MKRRDFLKGSSVLAAHLFAGQTLLTPLIANRAQAQTGLPIKDLLTRMSPSEGAFLVPTDPKFAEMMASFNLRTQLKPQLRALCQTPAAVAKTINWARDNNIPLAIRGAGHSYEGYSQSGSVVIDTRFMNSIEVDDSGEHATFGSGIALGQAYAAIAEKGRVIPAGSCPTVGIAGHTTGGGMGLLGRALGLACDSLESVEIVDAGGKILNASVDENADLFWALRGGGNGQFGVITKLNFRTHQLDKVSYFSVGWVLPAPKALLVAKAWQEWLLTCPSAITSILKISKDKGGDINLRFIGQSVDSETHLRAQINPVLKVLAPTSPLTTATAPFMGAVKHFGGGSGYESILMKAKSDYLFAPMSDEGFLTLMRELQKLPAGTISALCDSYGGAINKVAPDATAFAHRTNARFSIQHYSQWGNAVNTPSRLEAMRNYYQALRPYVSGHAYVNYCDLDLEDYGRAYWGDNLERLQEVKAKYDPSNFFQHAQSVVPKTSA